MCLIRGEFVERRFAECCGKEVESVLKDCENVNQYSRKNENCHILRIIAFHGFGRFLLHSGTGQDAYTFLPLLKKRRPADRHPGMDAHALTASAEIFGKCIPRAGCSCAGTDTIHRTDMFIFRIFIIFTNKCIFSR